MSQHCDIIEVFLIVIYVAYILSLSSHFLMQSTIRLLLQRGADPNASNIPMPVLFFAVKAADVEAVKILLSKGALTSARLSQKVIY